MGTKNSRSGRTEVDRLVTERWLERLDQMSERDYYASLAAMLLITLFALYGACILEGLPS